MNLYQHRVQYYETDQMGITHHSNYIRWMEEARIDFLGQIGWNYRKLEESGIISPVTALDCKYRISTLFDDVITIAVWVEEFKGIKLKLGYEMRNEAGALVFEGKSEHCFLNREKKIVNIRKECPDFHKALSSYAESAVSKLPKGNSAGSSHI